MAKLRQRFKGLSSIGAAIDERLRRDGGALDLRHGAGAPALSGLTGGGYPGGGGGEPEDPPGGTGTFSLAGDSGAAQTISNGDTLTVAGGDGVATAAQATDIVQVSVDETVVRTTGDQSIDGVKTFAEFPVTPEAMPADDYQAANKRYVDTVHKQVFWAAGNKALAGYDINLPWDYCEVNRLVPSAPILALSWCEFIALADTGPATLAQSYAQFSWTSTTNTNELSSQSKVMTGAPFRKWGNRATIRARLRLNEAGADCVFEGLYISLNDTGANSASSDNLILAVSGATWEEIVLADVDLSEWGEYLRATVTAVGTTDHDNAGECVFDIEYIAVEQWSE